MIDVLDGVREHYRAPDLTERLMKALAVLGPEDRQLTPRPLAALSGGGPMVAGLSASTSASHSWMPRAFEAAKAWFAELRVSGPPPSPNLGVVMGPDIAQLAANLGRNLLEGRLGILTAVFEAASTKTRIHRENR
jgi:hypothetical protein